MSAAPDTQRENQSFAETALRLGGKSDEEVRRTGAMDKADEQVPRTKAVTKETGVRSRTAVTRSAMGSV